MLFCAPARAQLSATDDFEGYSVSPFDQDGGSSDWLGRWATNSEFAGGAYLDTNTLVNGAKSVALWGAGSEAGTSIRRAFPPTTNTMTISFSMRANFNAVSTNAPARRMAFTIRAGDGPGHFDNQRLSFFFAAGNNNFQWHDGTNRETSAITFASGSVYDVRAVMEPATRQYAFSASNRNTGATFNYSGYWTLGRNLEPMNSVAFIMRAPNITGQDAFLDNVSITAPGFRPAGPSIRKGDWWRIYKGTSTPPAQGTNQWFHPAFDDREWTVPSPSGFGYGDCDDNTELADMKGGYLNIFIRRPFVVGNPATIKKLTLGMDYDDGAIVFLNGTEVARLNLPAGTFSRTNGAVNAHESSRGDGSAQPSPKEFYAIDPALLVSGTNVLAVSGHNTDTNSSDFSLIVELYTNAALVRGPFIQMPNAGHTAAIAWRTAAEVDSVIEYGTDLAYSLGVISNGTPSRDHVIHIDGLAPGTNYYYRVRGHGEILSEGQTFRTRPAADQPYRVVVIGDHGQGSPGMYAVANLINHRNDFDAIFTVGDNIYGSAYGTSCNPDGAPGWYDPYWFELYGPAMCRVTTFPALGNHDWDTAKGQYMADYFHLPANGPAAHHEKNYSFDFGNMHVAVIDTEPYDDNTTVTMTGINAWLDADLASATQRWRMVILHRPPFTSQGNHNDHARVKENIAPILKNRKVHLVLQGHNHWYERMNPIDGTTYLTVGGSGAWLYDITTRKEYSARIYNERHSFTTLAVDGGRMTIQQINDLGEVIDTHQIDIDHPFAIDGLIDNAAWERAANGLKLYAAIRKNFLYVATQDAGEGNDHFVYIANANGAPRAAGWGKAGTVMPWGAFLADENDGAYQGWFNSPETPASNFNIYKSMTSGTNNNAPYANGVLEGTIDLAAHFGTFPSTLYLAAAPYNTTNGGALIAGAQVPAGNGDGNIDAAEFLIVNPRALALDLPVAVPSANQSVEAGMWVVVNGAASYSPSALPLTYAWEKTGGPSVFTTNFNQNYAALLSTLNVLSNTVVTLQLRVHDGRFFSDVTNMTVTITPMTDADSDGLSDQEELTGYDNALTPANPGGKITNPARADTDGDGMRDGDEALAGTNPNDSTSLLRMSAIRIEQNLMEVEWSSVSGRNYRFERTATLPSAEWPLLQIIHATSALTRATDANAHTNYFYRIGAEYP